MIDIEKDLFKLQDREYKEFHSRLMPTVDTDTIIGVRIPHIRAYAKSIKKDADAFLNTLPHKYYEENNLHAFLVAEIKDFRQCIDMLNKFLPLCIWRSISCLIGYTRRLFGKRQKALEYLRSKRNI